MKILLDECLPVDFRRSLVGHEVHTVQWAGFKSKRNGELLRSAELAGYEVFVTVDQGIPFQQFLSGRVLSIVVMRARTNQLEDLVPLASAVLELVKVLRPGAVGFVAGPER